MGERVSVGDSGREERENHRDAGSDVVVVVGGCTGGGRVAWRVVAALDG